MTKQRLIINAIALLLTFGLAQAVHAQFHKDILVVKVSGDTSYKLSGSPKIQFSASSTATNKNQFQIVDGTTTSGAITFATMISNEGYFFFDYSGEIPIVLNADPDNADIYYATFSYTDVCELPTSYGITPYVAISENEESITFEAIEASGDNYLLAAKTGYLLKGSSSEVTLNVGGTTEAPGQNYLVANLNDLYISSSNVSDIYSLGYIQGTGVAFYHMAEGDILAEGKAYIDGSTLPSPTMLKMSFGGNGTTGISSVETAENPADNAIYTIQGIRVSDMSRKGIYIVNGKKVLIK